MWVLDENYHTPKNILTYSCKTLEGLEAFGNMKRMYTTFIFIHTITLFDLFIKFNLFIKTTIYVKKYVIVSLYLFFSQ